MLAFNAGGKLYGPNSNYFIPTTAWLDYTLRMLGLMPLQAIHLGEMQNESPIRLALLCRSESAPCHLERTDEWMLKSFHSYIFSREAQFDWENIKNNPTTLNYTPYDRSVLGLNSNKSLYSQLAGHPRYISSRSENILTLESEI